MLCALLSRSVVSDSLQQSPWTVVHQLLCPWGFSRQEYWSELPCSPQQDLPNTGIEPRSPTLQEDSPSYQLWWSFVLNKLDFSAASGTDNSLTYLNMFLSSFQDTTFTWFSSHAIGHSFSVFFGDLLPGSSIRRMPWDPCFFIILSQGDQSYSWLYVPFSYLWLLYLNILPGPCHQAPETDFSTDLICPQQNHWSPQLPHLTEIHPDDQTKKQGRGKKAAKNLVVWKSDATRKQISKWVLVCSILLPLFKSDNQVTHFWVLLLLICCFFCSNKNNRISV